MQVNENGLSLTCVKKNGCVRKQISEKLVCLSESPYLCIVKKIKRLFKGSSLRGTRECKRKVELKD